jgi:hypothetical protein
MNGHLHASASFDVVVFGGGMSGYAAAVAAARRKCSVLLVERAMVLGGAATLALVQPFQTFHSPSGRIIGGIAQEVVYILEAARATPGHMADPIGFAASITPVDSEWLKLILADIAAVEGVTVWRGTTLAGLEFAGDRSHIHAVYVRTGGEVRDVAAKVVVDATGNGDASALAGVPMNASDEPQPMSWLYKVGGVDVQEVIAYQRAHPDDFVLDKALFQGAKKLPEALANPLAIGCIGVCGFFDAVAKAGQSGSFPCDRDRLLFFSTPRPREVLVNTTRASGPGPAKPHDPIWLSSRASACLAQIEPLHEFMQRSIPGFARSFISQIADEPGIRETRRIVGRYTLTENEIVSGASFNDGIAKGAFPIDIHEAEGGGLTTKLLGGPGSYDIPLRCLLNDRVANLITVGKCISVTHEAFSSSRVIPTATAVGEAGGAAAARIVERGAADGFPTEADVASLRRSLADAGAIIFDDQVDWT